MNPSERLLEERLLNFASHPSIRDARMYIQREQKECMADTSIVLLELFPNLFDLPVNVSWRSGSPYVNWETWESERYICLTSEPNSLFYAQIAFQLFHELAHLAIGYNPDVHRERYGNGRHITAWFSETLCMALSYVGLSRLAEIWKTSDTSWKRRFSYAFIDYRYEDVNSRIHKLGLMPVDISAYLRKHATERLRLDYNDRMMHSALAIRIAEMIEEYAAKDVLAVQALTSVESHTYNNRRGHFQFMDFRSWVDFYTNERGKKSLTVDICDYLTGLDVRLTDFAPQ